jgi:hypothetical protein
MSTTEIEVVKAALDQAAAGKLKELTPCQTAAVKHVVINLNNMPHEVHKRIGIYVQLSPYLRALLRLTEEQERERARIRPFNK